MTCTESSTPTITITRDTPATLVIDQSEALKALALARGKYQRALLAGVENLSGSSLAGKAKRYSGRYAQSRSNLLDRMTAAGVKWSEARGPHNRRILVIG